MRPALRVEVAALGALVIHLASKQVCEDCAQNENPPEHRDGQKSIGQALHELPMADLPLVVSL